MVSPFECFHTFSLTSHGGFILSSHPSQVMLDTCAVKNAGIPVARPFVLQTKDTHVSTQLC
jgi:hypothetical protein